MTTKKCGKINLSAAVISNTKLLQKLEDKESGKEKGKNSQEKTGAKGAEKVDVIESSIALQIIFKNSQSG